MFCTAVQVLRDIEYISIQPMKYYYYGINSFKIKYVKLDFAFRTNEEEKNRSSERAEQHHLPGKYNFLHGPLFCDIFICHTCPAANDNVTFHLSMLLYSTMFSTFLQLHNMASGHPSARTSTRTYKNNSQLPIAHHQPCEGSRLPTR